jgi:hypothetical protein
MQTGIENWEMSADFKQSDLTRQGILHAREASGNGYHLEAITTWESLIWEGMARYIASRTGKAVEVSTSLNALLKRLKKVEEDYDLNADEKTLCGLRHQVDTWRKRREEAVHSLALIEEGKHHTFRDKVSLQVQYARNGEALFKEIRDLLGILKIS